MECYGCLLAAIISFSFLQSYWKMQCHQTVLLLKCITTEMYFYWNVLLLKCSYFYLNVLFYHVMYFQKMLDSQFYPSSYVPKYWYQSQYSSTSITVCYGITVVSTVYIFLLSPYITLYSNKITFIAWSVALWFSGFMFCWWACQK